MPSPRRNFYPNQYQLSSCPFNMLSRLKTHSRNIYKKARSNNNINSVKKFNITD